MCKLCDDDAKYGHLGSDFNVKQRGNDFEVTPIERALKSQADVRESTVSEVLCFLNDLCHPEQYGHAVTKEVRQRARQLATALETQERMP